MKAILFLIIVCPIVLSIVFGCLYAEWLHKPEVLWAKRILRHFEIIQSLMAQNNQESSSEYEREIRFENSLKISREINRLIPLVSIAMDVKFLGSIFGHDVPGLTEELIELPLEELDILPIVPEFKKPLPVAKFAPIEPPFAELVKESPIPEKIEPVVVPEKKIEPTIAPKPLPKPDRYNPVLDDFWNEK